MGQLLAARNQRRGLPVVQLNAFGMLYGAALVALYARLRGDAFVFDHSAPYLLSIGFLALFGSVLAFGAYLTLIGRIGADRAGYAGAAIPVVALLLSGLFEGFRWQAGTAVDPGVPVTQFATRTEIVDHHLGRERMLALLDGALAGVAVSLCCLGIYGLRAFESPVARARSRSGWPSVPGVARSHARFCARPAA